MHTRFKIREHLLRILSYIYRFAVLDGMYSTINLPDNLGNGYSHFYAEVMRVKKVAEHLGQSKRLLVIFDELFRGTNVKDAFDATVSVTEAFGDHRNCGYVISTHIIEVGQTLTATRNNLQFVYMPTMMKNGVPHYPYTMVEGITDDRHGMVIIQNENIIDIIRNGKPVPDH